MAIAIDIVILERIARSSRPGVALRLAIRSVKVRRRRRPEGDPAQPVLPITRVLMASGVARAVEVPTSGALFPWERVTCRLGSTLLVSACLTRRSKVWASGGEAGRGGGPKGQPVFKECQGCELGSSYAARAPWFTPPKPTRPADLLSPEQRVARERYLGQAQHVVGCGDGDPLAIAASMTPDDRVL